MTRARIRVATLVATLVAAGTLTGVAATTAAPAGAASLPQCPTAALAKAKGTVNISFWESMVRANGTTLTTLTNKFNASQSKIHVTLVDQNSYTTTWQKYEAGLTNGQLPAVAQLQDINLQGAIDTQSILPAQSCINAHALQDVRLRLPGARLLAGGRHPAGDAVRGFEPDRLLQQAGVHRGRPHSRQSRRRHSVST